MGIRERFTKKSGMDKAPTVEKNGKTVTQNYEGLLDQYHPTLTKTISAAIVVDKALADLALAQNNYQKCFHELTNIGQKAGINPTVVENLTNIDELLEKVNRELSDFQKAFASDMIKPFESKQAADQTYLRGELNGFRDNFNKVQADLNNKNKTLAKLEKNRGKSKKDDKKRIDLERDIDERSKKLEEYTNHNLKKSVLEQNRRFVFLADKGKAHCKKLLLLADQNSEILRDQVNSLDSTQINLEAEAEKVAENMRPRKSIYETHPDGPHLEPRATSQMTSSPLGSPIMLNATPNGVPQDGKKRVKASHDYGGDGKTKLTLCVGDIVQLLIPQPRDGWHYGQNERTTDRGWFPIQYTTKVENGLRRM